MSLQDYRTYTNEELALWAHLRALEWFAWPAFVSQPIVPVLLAIFQSWLVLAAFFVIDVLWRFICHRAVHVGLSQLGVFVARTGWVFAVGSAIYLFFQHRYVLAIVALLWPLIATATSVLSTATARLLGTRADLFQVESAFADRVGLTPQRFQVAVRCRTKRLSMRFSELLWGNHENDDERC
jgi:hypothetical protein